MNTIRITLNGEPMELASGATLADCLAHAGQSPRGVGTAVNADFVARDARANHLLHDGDAVCTFVPITGG